MLILAVDTAGEVGSIALADDDGIREEVTMSGPGSFAQALFGEIEGLLKRQGVQVADIDLFAAASGPGSFTGVRIGLAAIKGLAEVAGKPAVGVSNLEALAEFGTADRRAVVIDARRGEVYAALFSREGVVLPATVSTLAAFVAEVGDRQVEWVSPDSPPALAGAIAKLAMRRYRSGERCDPASIEADYVRRSDAEISWRQQ